MGIGLKRTMDRMWDRLGDTLFQKTIGVRRYSSRGHKAGLILERAWKGAKLPNKIWDDIDPKRRMNRLLQQKDTGYPTQKPLRLLERIIKASSNPMG